MIRFSRFRKSGAHPGTSNPGEPLSPPGGVIPPFPEKYGTFDALWLYSKRQVMNCFGM